MEVCYQENMLAWKIDVVGGGGGGGGNCDYHRKCFSCHVHSVLTDTGIY